MLKFQRFDQIIWRQ